MRSQDYLHLRCQRRQSPDRSRIGVEIGFGAIKPDGRRIVGVAGKQQAVGSIKQRDSVGGMPRCGDDFKNDVSEIDTLAVVNVGGYLPWPGGVGLRVKSLRQCSADLVRSNFRLRIVLR